MVLVEPIIGLDLFSKFANDIVKYLSAAILFFLWFIVRDTFAFIDTSLFVTGKIIWSIVSGLSEVVVIVVAMSSFSLFLSLDSTSSTLVLVSSFGFDSNLILDLVYLDLVSWVSSSNDV